MKKILLSSITFFMLAIVFATSAFAIEWIFDSPDAVNAWKYTGMSAEFSQEGVHLKAQADDIYMHYNFSEQGNTAEYPYIALVMKAKTTAPYGGFFYTTSESPDMGKNHFSFNLTNRDGEWQSYIIENKHANWKGAVKAFRIDPINVADKNADITIARMGLFKTKTDAQAFIDADPIMAEAAAKQEAELAAKKEEYAKMESPKFIFDSIEAMEEWAPSGADISFRFGYLCMVPKNNDPIMSRIMENPFPASEFKYFAIRTKAISTCLHGTLFFSNSVYNGYSDKSHYPYPLTYNEWTNTIVNLEEEFPERWTGLVDQVRIDPINPAYYDANAEIYLDRLGFFRTQEEAEAFLSGGREDFEYDIESTIVKETFKAIIPANTVEKYDPEKYLLTGANDALADKDAIVTFTDENGVEKPVALSYVNAAGYATYITGKPGTYKIGHNSKAFVDTDGHWAAENIKFVANRALFGGTSETEFSPDMTMTRGMFITVLGRMHGVDTSKYDGNTGYADVNSAEYYAPYIQWAKENALALPVSENAFAPEEPITRKDMALITSNYMNAFGYQVKQLDEVEEFNDLEGFTAAEKEAIVLIQKAGIINGKGEGKFDPNGISTRAEVATVMQRVVKSILRVNILYNQYPAEYFSRERIRISTWSYYFLPDAGDNFKILAEAGFDNIVFMNNMTDHTYDMADKYGIELFTGTMPTRKDDTTSNPVFMNASIYDHPSFNGSYLGDEPGTTEYDYLSAHANNYIEKMPGKIPFLNLLPMYANAAQLKYNAGAAAIEYYDPDPNLYRNYCDEFCEKFNTSYICVDIYPLHSSSTYNDYVESINQVASSARDHGKEFWCCLQAFGWNGGKRTPTLNEYSWQCYSLLSFGCRNLIWWYYEGNESFPSLIDRKTMKPTQAYYDSQTIIAEIKALSDTFIQYNNVGAFTYTPDDQRTPNYLKMSGEYKDFKAISDISADQPILIGCFDKKDGNGNAFTLVNMSELLKKKSATVKFKAAEGAVVTSFKGGNQTVLTPVDGYYTVTLDWGMGEFFTIG